MIQHHQSDRYITQQSPKLLITCIRKLMLNITKIMEAKALVILTAFWLSAHVSSSALAIADLTTPNSHNNQQSSDSLFVTVQTTSGLLNGTRRQLNLADNQSIYRFLGVPYAEAPTGALRFQKPLELAASHQSRILDASKFGKTCPQFRHLTRFVSPLLNVDLEHQISEDCLQLNLFVPTNVGQLDRANENRLDVNKQLPVIVWIPGEGFDFADARQFDGSYLAHKTQSIVVTVQYRVGVLGFLQAPTLNITGNMGLYDQIMALDWVHSNIQAFGGDPERVTLMGRFTGSMSISALMTAPNQELIHRQGKLLFQRVMLLSGVAVQDWSIEPQLYKRVEDIEKAAQSQGLCGELIGDQQVAACLKQLPVHDLLRISGYKWRLSIDNQLVGARSPVEAIEENLLPSQLEAVMLGETGAEGALCMYRHLLDTANNYAQLIEDNKLTEEHLNEIVRDDMLTYFGYNLTRSSPVQSAFEYLLLEADRSEEITDEVSAQFSGSKLRERYLATCAHFMVKSHNNRLKRNILAQNQLASTRMDYNKKPVEVFHYELKYKPTFSLAPDYIKTAAHGDDVPLIFGLLYNQPRREVNEADLLMSRKMMAYVGNFVHGNNPLLSQHSTISGQHEAEDVSAATAFVSMDCEDQQTTTITANNNPNQNQNGIENSATSSVVSPRRNWSSEGQVHAVEFNENDSNQIRTMQSRNLNQSARPTESTQSTQITSNVIMSSQYQPRARVYILESPITMTPNRQTMLEFRASRPGSTDLENSLAITRSQRLIELHHRSQQLDVSASNSIGDNLWSKKPSALAQIAAGPQVQHAQFSSLSDSSSFMTMLLFSSCIVIFTLMSLCLGLCLIIFRSQMRAGLKKHPIHQYANSSSSSCDICDDAQRVVSMNSVLDDNHHQSKANRVFGNMFVKLANHHHTNSQLASAASVSSPDQTIRQQQTGSPCQSAAQSQSQTSTSHNHHHHERN